MRTLTPEEKKDFATRLEVSENEVERLHKIANDTWHLALAKEKETNKWFVHLYVNRPTPSGCTRFYLQSCLDQPIDSEEEAKKRANQFKDEIQLSQLMAELNGIPRNIFILLDPLV